MLLLPQITIYKSKNVLFKKTSYIGFTFFKQKEWKQDCAHVGHNQFDLFYHLNHIHQYYAFL